MLAFILGSLAFTFAGIFLLYAKKIPYSRVVRPMIYFWGLLPFHYFLLGRVYIYGAGTTQILIRIMYLDDIPFFLAFPFFISVFASVMSGVLRK